MEKMQMSPVVEMIVHDRDSSVSDLGVKSFSAIQLSIGETFHAALRRRVVRRLDAPGKPCRSEFGYNQIKVRGWQVAHISIILSFVI